MSTVDSDRSSLKKLRELDAQLAEYSSPKKYPKPAKKGKKPFSPLRWLAMLAVVAGLLLLPFFLLIRVSLFTYSSYGLNGWLALGSGVLATVTLLVFYGSYLSFRFSGKARMRKFLFQSTSVLVLSYCCYALLYLSSMNVKNEEERAHYRSLHPILRVTVATATLADSDLVITDMHRTPEEYLKMGLTPRQKSLHYRQSTGYVHAVDLRTRDRAEWKNWLTAHLLNMLGYQTLRHVGTADHLHVSLPLND